MSSDSPRMPESKAEPEAAAPEAAAPGARVIGLASEEVSSPGQRVPAGVWNTPAEMDASESTERPLRRVGQVVEFPRPITQKRRRSEPPPRKDEPTGRQRLENGVPAPAIDGEPERPKFLASELLKTNWFPREPLTRTARWGSVGVGAIGAIAMLVIGGFGLGALVLGAVLLACAIAGAVPIPPRIRAMALAMLGAAGVIVVAWIHAARGGDPTTPLLVVCATMAAGALFFRAAHRTSRLGRALVGVGLGALTLWGMLSGGVDTLIVASIDWQSWVVPVLRLLLAVVVLASLLSFLDPRGHGGAWVAGGAMLGWLVLYAAGSVMLAIWPVRGAGSDLGDSEWLAICALPLVASIASVGMCQVLALFARPSKPKRDLTRATIG